MIALDTDLAVFQQLEGNAGCRVYCCCADVLLSPSSCRLVCLRERGRSPVHQLEEVSWCFHTTCRDESQSQTCFRKLVHRLIEKNTVYLLSFDNANFNFKELSDAIFFLILGEHKTDGLMKGTFYQDFSRSLE